MSGRYSYNFPFDPAPPIEPPILHPGSISAVPVALNRLNVTVRVDVDRFFPQQRISIEVTRLFPDTRGEEQAYFKRHGYFPIRHLVAVREELLQREPWLALNLVDAFTEAKRRAAHY